MIRAFKPVKITPAMTDVRKTYAMFARVMRSVGGIRNIAAPVAMLKLPIEITLQSPQPTSNDCIRTRSLSSVGTLVKITNRKVPVTIA